MWQFFSIRIALDASRRTQDSQKSSSFLLHLTTRRGWLWIGSNDIVGFPQTVKRSPDYGIEPGFTIQAQANPSIEEPSSTGVPSFRGQSATSRSPLPQLNTTSGGPTGLYTAELNLTVFSAEVDVKVNEKLSKELIRCTTKELPSRLKYSLVYVGSLARRLVDVRTYRFRPGKTIMIGAWIRSTSISCLYSKGFVQI